MKHPHQTPLATRLAKLLTAGLSTALVTACSSSGGAAIEPEELAEEAPAEIEAEPEVAEAPGAPVIVGEDARVLVLGSGVLGLQRFARTGL